MKCVKEVSKWFFFLSPIVDSQVWDLHIHMCPFDWWFFERFHPSVIAFLYEGKHQLLTPSWGHIHIGFIPRSCHDNLWCQFAPWSYTGMHFQALLPNTLDNTHLIFDYCQRYWLTNNKKRFLFFFGKCKYKTNFLLSQERCFYCFILQCSSIALVI